MAYRRAPLVPGEFDKKTADSAISSPPGRQNPAVLPFQAGCPV